MTGRNPEHRVLRIALILSGAGIATFALLMDRLGLGQPGGFGLGQFLLSMVGLFTILAGALGKEVVGFYKGTAIVLLNALVLLAFLELAAIAAFRSGLIQPGHEARFEAYLALPYYRTQDWSEAYWEEAYLAESYGYQPYVMWRHAPFAGELINVGEAGTRMTPGSECGPGGRASERVEAADRPFTVFTFGGSSMWGWGSPDWGTIPAHLQKGLAARLHGPVCVVNYGEDAYVSTQEVLTLLAELQADHVPDAVVFYDGVNDVFSAYQNGRADTHLNAATIAAKLETPARSRPLSLADLRLVQLVQRVVGPSDPLAPLLIPRREKADDLSTDELVSRVVARYLGNVALVQAWARDYGFEAFFFWQPNLAIEGKSLTESERASRARLDPYLIGITQEVYARVAEAAADDDRLYDIADALDAEAAQVWIDAQGHLTPDGNELIARRMLEAMERVLPPAPRL